MADPQDSRIRSDSASGEGAEPDLLHRARRGDQAALAELLRIHAPAARAAVAGRIPDPLRALISEEDILQQTFADVFVDVARFVPCGEGAFRAWLVSVTRSNLVDAIRMLEAGKRREDLRQPTASSYDLLLDALPVRSQTSPSGRASRKEAIEALRRAIDRLPPLYRRVVEAVDLGGRSVRELAPELGRSEGAVHLLRHRAHRRLAELLGSSAPFFHDSV